MVDTITSVEAGKVLAPIISGISVVVLYHYLGSEYLGADETKIWNKIRRVVLLGGDNFVRKKTEFALTNKAKKEEIVGMVEMSDMELAEVIEGNGGVQSVLSGLKKRTISETTKYESGSMVIRESKSDLIPDVLAKWQLHIFWFTNDDGSKDVYAHWEYSSLNPLFAWPHYLGIKQNPKIGVEKAMKIINGSEN